MEKSQPSLEFEEYDDDDDLDYFTRKESRGEPSEV